MEIAVNGVCWVLLSLLTCQGVLSQTFTTSSGTALTNQITVGNASDILIEIICNQTTGTNSWSFSNGDIVPSPLTNFGISQNPEQGVLRIYPGTLVEDYNQFTCSNGSSLQNITLLLTESLFFTKPLPAVFYNDTSLNCFLPNIPEAIIINDSEIVNGTTLQFCNVSTDRGSFQSRRVPVIPMQDIMPQFVIQPMNVTVLTNRSAGFSCSIRPDNTLINITWYFEPVPLDVGSGNDSYDLMVITNGVISGLPHFGTSILSLNYVTDHDRGVYFCVAFFNNGNFTSSGQAFLELTDNPPNPSSPFRLLPPSTLTVYEGTNVTLPCLASAEFTTNWTFPTSSNNVVITNQAALSIVDVSRDDTGNYTCRVNETDATVMLNVLASLQFEVTPDNETIVIRGQSVNLTCVASGNPAPGPIQWFRNNTKLSTEGNTLILINVQPTDTAIYQCTAQLEVFPYTSIAAYTYLNVQFIDEATVNPDTQLVDPLLSFDFTITCTIPSHPLVNITWTVGNIPSNTRQLPVGFRGPSVSELSLNSGDLSGYLTFNCSAELSGNISTATAIVNAYSNVTLIDEPDMTEPVLFGFTVTFSCRASSIPRPTISWFRNESGIFMEVFNTLANTTIVSSPVGNRETNSTLTIIVDENNDFTEYRCFADNAGFFNATSRNALLVRGEKTSIVADLITNPVVEGEMASYNCSVRGFPQPNVSWIVNGMDFNELGFTVEVMNISSSELNSILTGNITANKTIITCVANNTFNRVTTNITQIIGGPPLQPDITNITPLSRSATVQWNASFSFFDINNYTITLNPHNNGNTNLTFTITDTMIIINSTHLSPFINYTVTLIANNRAGASPSTIQRFQTLQAAPEGSPTINVTSSTRQGEIFVLWSPVSSEARNGIILSYIVEYSTGDNIRNKTVNHTGAAADTQNTTLTSLEGGTTYTLRILAATIAGEGPFSQIQMQTTISNPPPITGLEPAVPAGVSVTTTTIPIQIPTFTTTNVQFIWVVVIKLNSTVQSALFPAGSIVEPDNRYPTNSSFISAVDFTGQEIPYGSPYVAAEITLTSPFSLPYTFYIGDNSLTSSINDQPNLYSNPPLQEGTTYTSFIRAFPPAVPSSDHRNKRQTTTPRQYTVFTSTRFSDPQTTSVTSSDTLSGGAIAAIVLVILILFAILVVLIIIALILYFRPRAKFIPPRNRQGSVRLTESQRLLNSPHDSPLFRGPNSQVSVVTDLRKKTEFATLPPSDEREPIDITHFPEYVKSLHANSDHLFSEEYELITIKSPSLAHQASLLQCNQAKNRYANINSYDQSRVILSSKAGVEGSDYINANYIDGYSSRNAYIACQGPLAETTEDFWRMVWEQKSTCIVMLTNCVEKGRPKCHQYWPQTGSVTLGDLAITLIDQQILAYYTIRTFKLSVGSDTREVKQFHYTAWPDFGVPDHPNPILSFIRRVNNFGHDGSDIVHCSAGVGRSGTYIAIRSMMQMIEAEGKVDIFNFVLDMRHKRNYMVQTEAQYMFVHDALVELIRVGDTEMTVQGLSKELKVLTTSDSDSDICPLQAQFDKLNALDVPIPSQFISATLPINNSKNRFPDILPYEAYRVRLLMLPGVNGSDYINASYVDGYLRCNQFIMTQGPLQNTVDDFWRMVWEHRVSAIVLLCQLEENGKEQSAQYWPTEKLTQYGDMFIETLNETDTGFYKVREFQITHTKQNNEVRQIKQFHYTEWSENQTPSKSAPIIDMIGLVQKAHHLFGGGPVVVHDCASIGRSGTFCVLNIVIERLKVEGMIDIFFTVHSLRRKHPGIVATYDQYKFCFDTVLDYLDSFDKYANFD